MAGPRCGQPLHASARWPVCWSCVTYCLKYDRRTFDAPCIVAPFEMWSTDESHALPRPKFRKTWHHVTNDHRPACHGHRSRSDASRRPAVTCPSHSCPNASRSKFYHTCSHATYHHPLSRGPLATWVVPAADTWRRLAVAAGTSRPKISATADRGPTRTASPVWAAASSHGPVGHCRTRQGITKWHVASYHGIAPASSFSVILTDRTPRTWHPLGSVGDRRLSDFEAPKHHIGLPSCVLGVERPPDVPISPPICEL